jgi:hypothetical protein
MEGDLGDTGRQLPSDVGLFPYLVLKWISERFL